MADFTEPFGSTIFCDDVRTEIGNKVSYMGVYIGAIQFASFPATLPKFGMAIDLNEPYENARIRDFIVTVRAFFPGLDEPLFSIEIPTPPPQAISDLASMTIDADSQKLMNMRMVFIAAPLTINEAGLIKVRASYGDKTIKLGSIRAELAQAQNPIAASVASQPS